MALDRLPQLDDDGLHLPEVGAWAEKKYRLIATYSEMFATAMKDRWDSRVYVDLYAAAGRARIKDTGRIVPTSAALALSVPHRFDKYVLCDIDPRNLGALEVRARRIAPDADIAPVLGDCNTEVSRVVGEIPSPRRGRTVLSFCVVDPCNLSSLRFETIAALAERFVDFLVLIPSYMDAHRNLDAYLRADSTAIGDYLGDSDWRDKWLRRDPGLGSRDFGVFVVDRFGCAMRDLGFLYDGAGETEPVRDKHLLLYHLAFFSRSERGRDFWRKARRHASDQGSFAF